MTMLPPDSVQRTISAFTTVELGDWRREQRLRRTVSLLAQSPAVSFPDAMGSDADLQGGYRLVNNPHVTLGALIDAYSDETAARARSLKHVLAIHDSTKCKFEQADPREVGYLHTGKPGFTFHYTLVVDAEGKRRPLGVTNGEAIFSDEPPRKRRRKGRRPTRAGNETARDESRDFLRWKRGIERTENVLGGCMVTHVADRESDSYALMCEANRFVFRLRVDARRARGADGVEGTVRELAERARGRLRREVAVSARKGMPGLRTAHAPRKRRTAELEFSATAVEISRPRYCEPSLPKSLQLGVVRVLEVSPPADEEPIEWLLYTTLPISTEQEIAEVVDIYRARWLIEECNKALKTGCLYEEREFESREALLAVLGMSLPIACEILWLRNETREQPTRPAREILTDVQIEVLRAMGRRKLATNPTAQDAMRAIADMAGHKGSNGDPGWIILQRGMSKLLAYVEAWTAALEARRQM